MDLIRRIRGQELSPGLLSHDDRRLCVEYLTSEGYSVPEIAGILRTSDRTVMRDRAKAREANAVAFGPDMLPQMVGRLIGEADAAIGRLKRLAREKDAPHASKVDAERSAWGIAKELVQSLQRLGYLPMAVAHVHADLTHRLGEESAPEYDELFAELERLEGIREGCRLTGEGINEHMSRAKEALARLAAHRHIGRVASEIEAHSKEAEQ